MRFSIFALATTAVLVSAAAPNNSIPLGKECTTDAECFGNSECYGQTKDTIPVCGNFNAGCKSNADCAYNSCDNGLCSGYIAPHSIALGETCASDEQCKGNSTCYGQTKDTIPSCGNFNAECTSDADCAYNTCQAGLCNGFLAPHSYQLGETCVLDEQCVGDSTCYGQTKDTIKQCGNFNAKCSKDADCAYNTCENGLCSGYRG
ncbi:uncharacterized protein RCC_01576 [Ramularia collo-cygni]|uniref:Dickkopf N-terminal cysteine-rich domain-containing protein n=1 Tax=Ramularia collo-cygni TaxID=112498 RepID=A0A2D3ULY6_9PEZI|nr:uncharacterized protein RCC_01576 [Ramularia collo-cygni]CZT15742.1 uncharacterized protein RCC_01576 [Ramularia collo-cygni]